MIYTVFPKIANAIYANAKYQHLDTLTLIYSFTTLAMQVIIEMKGNPWITNCYHIILLLNQMCRKFVKWCTITGECVEIQPYSANNSKQMSLSKTKKEQTELLIFDHFLLVGLVRDIFFKRYPVMFSIQISSLG